MRPVFGFPTSLLRTLAVLLLAPLAVGSLLIALQVADLAQRHAAAATHSARIIAAALESLEPSERVRWLEESLASGGEPALLGLEVGADEDATPLFAGTAEGTAYSALSPSGASLRVYVQPLPVASIWLRGLAIAAACALVLIAGWIAWLRPEIASADRSFDRVLGALRSVRDSQFDTRIPESGEGRMRELERSVNDTARALDQNRERANSLVATATEELRSTLEEMEIKNVELDLARKRAVGEARDKAQFLANMSHEIRTPMNSIVGYAGLLTDTPLTGAQQSYARRITRSAHSLLEIIEDILSLSRLEAGKLKLASQPFNIAHIANHCMEMLAPAAYEKGLRLRTFIEVGVPATFVGDPLRLRQILVNFLTNAVKFTERGSVSLHIGVKRQTRHNALLSLTVTDTGRGIARGDRQRLFDAFTETSRGEAGGGTGLGLAIVRSLTNAMDGTLSLESELNKGSSFRVRIPMRTDFHERPAFLDGLAGKMACLALTDASLRQHLATHLKSLSMLVRTHASWRDLVQATGTGDSTDFVVADVATDEIDEFAATSLEARHPPIVLLESADRAAFDRIDEATGGDALPAFASVHAIVATMARRLGHRVEAYDPLSTAAPLPDITGARVLLADDDRLGRAWLQELLTRHGVHVTACADGGAAIEHARQSRFDVIFLDARMPIHTGIEAAHAIRRESRNVDTPIYALTASALTEDRERFAAAGMNECLVKPASVEDLVTRVAAALAQRDALPREAVEHPTDDAHMDAMLRDELVTYRRALHDDNVIENVPTLFEVAHRLHGAAAICRLESLEQSAAQLENVARSGATSGRRPAIESVVRCIDEILQTTATTPKGATGASR